MDESIQRGKRPIDVEAISRAKAEGLQSTLPSNSRDTMDMETNTRVTAEHPPLRLLDSWLEENKTCNNSSPRYCHLLFRKKDTIDPAVYNELYTYIDHAHEGARQALRAPLEDSLHPLHYGTRADPAYGYPHKLNRTALQGFFGEIFAGIVAEYYASDEERRWEVPVYLFRTHVVAFQQLEVMKQTDEWDRQIVGRTGDDGLAFARDDDGRIVAWLACEAKCTCTHSARLIADNHKKLSQQINRPVDLIRVIVALKDYRDDQYARDWISALQQFYWDTQGDSDAIRCDLAVYVCGQAPSQQGSWIPVNRPHPQYTGNRELTAAELHLPNVEDIIESLYGRMEASS